MVDVGGGDKSPKRKKTTTKDSTKEESPAPAKIKKTKRSIHRCRCVCIVGRRTDLGREKDLRTKVGLSYDSVCSRGPGLRYTGLFHTSPKGYIFLLFF